MGMTMSQKILAAHAGLDKVKAGTASEEEKTEFTRLTGITISTSFEDLSDADKQKYNIRTVRKNRGSS